MEDKNNRCPKCGNELLSNGICIKCGYRTESYVPVDYSEAEKNIKKKLLMINQKFILYYHYQI